MAVDKQDLHASVMAELYPTEPVPQESTAPLPDVAPVDPSPVPQPAPVPDVAHEQVMQQLGFDRGSDAKAVVQNVGESPDQTAEIVRLSSELGIPSDIIRRNQEVFAGQARSSAMSPDDWATMATKSPQLALMLTKRDYAGLMQDKIPEWQRTAAAARAFTEDRSLPWINSIVGATRIGQLSTVRSLGSLVAAPLAAAFGPDSPSVSWWYAAHDRIQSEQRAQATFDETGWQKVIGGAAAVVADPSNALIPGAGAAAGRATALAAESLTEQVINRGLQIATRTRAVPGMRAVSEAAMRDTSAAEVSGAMTGAALMASAQNFVSNSATISAANIQAGGSAYGTPSQLAWNLLDSVFQGVTTKLGGFIGVLSGMGPSKVSPLVNFGLSTAQGAAQGAESSVVMSQALGQEVDPSAVGVATLVGAVGNAGFAVPHIVGEYRSRARAFMDEGIQAAQNISQVQQLAILHAGPSESKYTARARQRTADAMRDVGVGDKPVFYPVDQFNAYWNKQGVDPAKVIEGMKGTIEGDNVKVSAAETIQYLADSTHRSAMLDMTKPEEGGWTLKESADVMSKLEENMKALDEEMAKRASTPEIAGGVKDDSALIQAEIEQQVKGLTGKAKEGAAEAGQLHADFYRTLADTMNAETGSTFTPHQLWKEHGARFESANTADGLGTYDPVQRAAKIAANGDVSTLVHESGHHFVDLYSRLAAKPDAPARMVKNSKALTKWFSDNSQQIYDSFVSIQPGHKAALDKSGGAEFIKANSGDFHSMAGGEHHAAWAAMHEFFARGFESYAQTGKAPSTGLKKVFDSFAKWISDVYASTIGNSIDYKLDTNVTPDIRKFMDRMLATDRAIAEADAETGHGALLDAAKRAGVNTQQVKVLSSAISEQLSAIREKAIAHHVNRVKEEDTAARRATRSKIEDEVRAELNDPQGEAFRDYQLEEQLQTHKVNAAEAKAILPPALFKKFRRFTAKDGAPIDQVSMGYSDPIDMASAMVELVPFDKRVAQEVNLRMEGANGPEMTGQQARDLAIKEMSGTDHQQIAEKELAVISSLLNKVNKPSEQAAKIASKARLEEAQVKHGVKEKAAEAKAKADEEQTAKRAELERHREIERAVIKDLVTHQVAKTPGSELSPHKWEAVARRESSNALRHFANKDYEKAYASKRMEIAALERAKQETKALADFKENEKIIQDFAMGKKTREKLAIGGSYKVIAPDGSFTYYERKLDAEEAVKKSPDSTLSRGGKALQLVDALIGSYNLEKLNKNQIQDRIAVKRLINEIDVSEDYSPNIPQDVMDAINAPNIREVSHTQVADLANALQNIQNWHNKLGTVMTTIGSAETGVVRDKLISEADAHAPAHPPGQGDLGDKWLRGVKAALNTINRMSTLTDRLDGGKMGYWFDTIQRPLAEINAHLGTWHNSHIKTMQNAKETFEGRNFTMWKQLPVEGTNLVMSHWKRIMIGAHWGNETGRQRVMQDLMISDPNVTLENVQSVLATLKPDDLHYIKELWKQNNSIYPEVEHMYRRLGEKPPTRVDGMAYEINGQLMEGGYYPISYRDAKPQTTEEAMNSRKIGAAAAQLANGYTHERVAEVTGKALDYDPNVQIRHLSEVGADIHWREFARDLDSIIGRNNQLADAVSAKYGRDFWNEYKAFIDTSIVGPPGAHGAFEKTVGYLRNNTTAATLGYSLWSMIQQPLGATNAMAHEAVGPVGFFSAAAKTYSNPVKYFALARKMSPDFMGGQRLTNFDPNMADARNADTPLNFMRPVTKYGFHAIGLTQSMIDVPTFLAAFEHYSNTHSEPDAIARAEQVVRDTMGSGENTELTALHRSQVQKLFTMFATYPITQLNQISKAVRNTSINDPKTVIPLVQTLFFAVLMPIILQQAAQAALKKEKVGPAKGQSNLNWAFWTTAKGVADMIPVVRDVSGLMVGQGASAPSFLSAPSALAKLIYSTHDKKEGLDYKAALHAMPLLPGGVGALPWNQLSKIYDAIVNPNENPVSQGMFGRPAPH